jgi:subtilisin
MTMLPAWSWQFDAEHLQTPTIHDLLDEITPQWAWGGSTGEGVRVAVVDSGIDNDHPAIAGAVRGWAAPIETAEGMTYDDAPHTDSYGHATACAGIIRGLAPGVELYSVKVLGAGLSGRGQVFAAGLRWAIEHDMHAVNLSLGTTKRDFFGLFHELADDAYFRNIVLVTAANNMPVPSFPSLYASVISVASQLDPDPYQFSYNPSPPVDFGAPGVDVHIPWLNGSWLTGTGNSYAAPHITGLVCRILGKHPGLTPFQVKTILRATAANTRRRNAVIREA